MSADRLDSAARERMLELLADRAIHGLSSTEQAELEPLLAASGEDDESVDRAAAAAHLAFEALLGEKKAPALSEDLRARLVAGGRAAMERNRSESPPRSIGIGAWSGWILATAAAVLALVGWWPKLAGSTEHPPTLAGERQRLVDEERDRMSASFKPGPDADGKNVSGDLVWSPRAQKGFMRFRGLPRNDATKAQYQLWIFDAKQDERYPIDGGVFDVDTATGEAIVRIDPRLKVAEPKMFAVTIERPGGVVVSGRERIVALAQM